MNNDDTFESILGDFRQSTDYIDSSVNAQILGQYLPLDLQGLPTAEQLADAHRLAKANPAYESAGRMPLDRLKEIVNSRRTR